MNKEKLDTLSLKDGMRYVHVQTPTGTYVPPVVDLKAAATCSQILAMDAVCLSVLGASIKYIYLDQDRAIIVRNGDTVAVAIAEKNHRITKSLNRLTRQAINVKPAPKPQPVIAAF